jgi:hypothetical protein
VPYHLFFLLFNFQPNFKPICCKRLIR